MKKKIYLIAIIQLIFLCSSQLMHAQNVHLLKGNEYFDRYAYSEAIPEYEKALEKNPEMTAAKIKLAACYRLTANSDKAEFWYGEIVKSPDSKPEYVLLYAQSLMNNKKYDLAKNVLTEFKKNNPTDQRASMALKTIENIPVYFKDTASYTTAKLNLNSENGDFSPVLYNKGIVFASSRETSAMQKKHEWTGQP